LALAKDPTPLSGIPLLGNFRRQLLKRRFSLLQQRMAPPKVLLFFSSSEDFPVAFFGASGAILSTSASNFFPLTGAFFPCRVTFFSRNSRGELQEKRTGGQN